MNLEEYRKLTNAKPAVSVSSMTAEEYRELKGLKVNGSKKGKVEKSGKGGKYGAIRKEVDGIVFDSTWEADRYIQLKYLLHAGEISDLKLQVPFDLMVNEQLIARYKADFVYNEGGCEIVEDAKGFKTPEYKLKKKLMKAIFDIDIRESQRR